MSIRKQDLTGQKIGRLTVTKCLGYLITDKTKKKRTVYECLCECGTIKNVRALDLLKTNFTKSCGCLKNETSKQLGDRRKYATKEESSWRHQYRSYQTGAATREQNFELSFQDFVTLCKCNCYLCNSEPIERMQSIKSGTTILSNGLDRVDTTQGYTLSNVKPCCSVCNLLKRTMNLNDFLSQCQRIVDFTKKD